MRATGDVLLGRAIRAAIEARDVPLRDLERQTGIGASRFRQWMGAHRRISWPDLRAIEKALDVKFHGYEHNGRSPHHAGDWWCRVSLHLNTEVRVTCRSTGNALWRYRSSGS